MTIDTSAWLVRDIKPGETEIYSAYYLIEQNAADSGSIVNTVSATGTDPSGTTITENSDDPETLTKGDPTVVEMDLIPSIEVIKTANVTDTNSDNKTGINDIITYTVKVENNGNTDLTGLTLVDVMTDLNGDLLSLSSQPVYMGSNLAGGGPTVLRVGEVSTFEASFAINQQAVNAGGVSNTVTVVASSPDKTNDVLTFR